MKVLIATTKLLLPLVWMGIIFWFSSLQKASTSGNYILSFIFFKTLHIIEYGVLFLLWRFALYNTKNGIWLAAVISVLYGISDELHQSFVPTREGRIRDVFIDTLGIIIFWRYLLVIVEERIKKLPWLKKTVFV